MLIAPGRGPATRRQVVRVILFGERGIEGDRRRERSRRLRVRDAARRDDGPRPHAAARGRARRTRTTRRRRASTTASTRRRSRTSCRARPSRSSSGSSATTSISSAASPPATRSRSSTARTRTTARRRSSTRPSRSAAKPRRVYRYQGEDGVDRLLRRGGPVAEEVPAAQADRRRDPALGLRLPPPPDPRLYQDAYGRRLGEPDRHADRRRRQRHRHQGGMGFRLRPPHRDPARQRLRDRLFATSRASPTASRRAPGSGRARSSAMSAIPACRPGRTSTTRSSSTAISSIR